MNIFFQRENMTVSRIAALLITTIILGKHKRNNAFTGLICFRNSHTNSFFEKRYQEKKNIAFRKHSQLYLESKDDDVAPTDLSDSNTKDQAITNTPVYLRRIGGRRKLKRRSSEKSSLLVTSIKNVLTSMLNNHRKYILWCASAALLWIFFLSRLFEVSSPSPNFVYYQSDVIERRIIGPDGNVEISRKESIKSNLPDLLRQQRQNTQSSKDLNEVEMRRFIDQFLKSD